MTARAYGARWGWAGFRALAAGLVMLLSGVGLAEAPFATAPLTVETASGPIALTVEMADSTAQKARGLMFRRALPADAGMLFDYHAPKTINMWMKNTFIPLDMIFIGGDFTVVDIVERTTPMSTAIISSDVPARAVLEVNGGMADRWGVAIGDRVRTPRFDGGE